jgi:Zn-dependent M32 family carboxypeptidase
MFERFDIQNWMKQKKAQDHAKEAKGANFSPIIPIIPQPDSPKEDDRSKSIDETKASFDSVKNSEIQMGDGVLIYQEMEDKMSQAYDKAVSELRKLRFNFSCSPELNDKLKKVEAEIETLWIAVREGKADFYHFPPILAQWVDLYRQMAVEGEENTNEA